MDLNPEARFHTTDPAVILFTGSRAWIDQWTVKNTLDEIVQRAVHAGLPELTFRHGACYPYPKWNQQARRKTRPHRSADYFVHLWIQLYGPRQAILVREDECPADWEGPCRPACHQQRRRNQPVNHRILRGGRLICPMAGNYRNREMVLKDPTPYFGIAFHQDNSNGTSNCIKAARALSVPMHEIEPEVLP